MILLVEVATDRSGTDKWKSTLRLGGKKTKTKVITTANHKDGKNQQAAWSKTNIIPDNFPNSFEHYSTKQTSAYYTGE